jgi:RNA polymerase sigma-70 factor (ECF subfamily)
MDNSIDPGTVRLLAEARAGNRESLGALLERYRAYLRSLACAKLDLPVQARANASDLVQEAFLEASRHFDQFHGGTEREWRHWLRRILGRRLSRCVRKHVSARKRSVRREISLPADPAQALAGHLRLADPGSSPSASAQRRELADLVAERLSRLSPAYRDVLVLRNLRGLDFEEVARRMRRSPGAVRVLWLRALDQLRRQRFSEDWL